MVIWHWVDSLSTIENGILFFSLEIYKQDFGFEFYRHSHRRAQKALQSIDRWIDKVRVRVKTEQNIRREYWYMNQKKREKQNTQTCRLITGKLDAE